MDKKKLYSIAVNLLIELVKVPSFSKEEEKSSIILESFFKKNMIPYERIGNNFLAQNKYFHKSKKTILLNSHHDTVKNSKSWDYDPFGAIVEGNKIIGLGTNDAGASLVSLLVVFLDLFNEILPYNLIMTISAEEEISGDQGFKLLLKKLDSISLGIVGEPTKMQMAISEKGLIVLDCVTKGKSAHAALEEGENAIYKALNDIQWLKTNNLPLKSNLLGRCKITITQIKGGYKHNIIPDKCYFVIDVRTNEYYKNLEVINYIQKNISANVKARSYDLNSSYIDPSHPIIQRGYQIGLKSYGSPTLSDQSLMNFDTVKIGPGDSIRSHTKNEYILISEIEEAINIYLKFLKFNF